MVLGHRQRKDKALLLLMRPIPAQIARDSCTALISVVSECLLFVH